MINRTKQNWEAGSKVKVGFMELVVLAAVASPGDWKSDQYLLRSAKGLFYAFVPHNGLTKIDESDANEMRAGRALVLA